MRAVFFAKIILPAILVIALFIITFSVVFIPMTEQGFMDRKKEMIKELTNSVYSIIDEYYQESQRGNITTETAMKMAVDKVRTIRYGDESKDYFWITDTQPVMIMHPFRPDLDSTEISDYTDPQGTRLFYEAAILIREDGEGYIDYWWQWKDDSTRIVPKLSYVKGFEPWNWIVGTGIYLEDVRDEIRAIKRHLTFISLGLIGLIAVIIFYITRQSFTIERRRIEAEEKLKRSRLKYKMLVEASAESTMMWMDGKLIYFNQPALLQTGYSREELPGKKIKELFRLLNGDFKEFEGAIDQSRNLEAKLIRKDNSEISVVLTVSRIEINNKEGYILIIKEITRHLMRDRSVGIMRDEIRESLLYMNTSISSFIREPETIRIERSMVEAAELMLRKKTGLIFVTQGENEITGTVNENALARYIVNRHNEGPHGVLNYMKAPLLTTGRNTPVYEALLIMEKESSDYLAIKDEVRGISGYVLRDDLLNGGCVEPMLLIKRAEKAELVEELQAVYDKLPAMVSLLLNANASYSSCNRLSAAAADAITKRVIELAIEKCGQPPVPFAFITLGSEGRREQTLKTDQDNAIIYQGENAEESENYFSILAERVNRWLNNIGYDYCSGEIMASNKKWRQPLSKWKNYFREWIEESDPESILDTSIFFDMRFVYGDRSLVEDLRKEILKVADARGVFLNQMAQAIHKVKAPSFSEKADSYDLKKAMLPVVGFARIYALKMKTEETNTIERLRTLATSGKVNESFVTDVMNAYEYLMYLRLRHQAGIIMEGKEPGNLLLQEKLSPLEKATLKAALNEINSIYTQLSFDFEGSM